MKARLALVILLVAVVALVGVGCGGYKTTGGGWFIDEGMAFGNKITFGFNAQRTSEDMYADAEGELQLVDHGSNTNIHGTFSETLYYPASASDNESQFWGTCSINGTDGYDFHLLCADNGEPGAGRDCIEIHITGYGSYYGYLGGGNIQVHTVSEEE